MRSIPAAVALLMVGLTISSIGALFFKSGSPSEALFLKSGSPSNMAQGEVRCEGAGAVVINIDGADYAVNGMASRRYPPIQRVWNSASHPESDIDRIIVRGLTLCDWDSKTHSAVHASVNQAVVHAGGNRTMEELDLTQPAIVFWMHHPGEITRFERLQDAVHSVMVTPSAKTFSIAWITIRDRHIDMEEIRQIERRSILSRYLDQTNSRPVPNLVVVDLDEQLSSPISPVNHRARI